jgi:uncharacterized damage-inducible protein DinB
MTQTQYPNTNEYPAYMSLYIGYVEERLIAEALEDSWEEWYATLNELPESAGDLAYAPNKWSLRQLIQHVVDTERVFAYRALRFARGDAQELPGFDENLYAQAAHARLRSLSDLLEELKTVRCATLHLFNSFDEDVLLNTGLASGHTVSVRALGMLVAGHMRHHLHILKSRYLPIMNTAE